MFANKISMNKNSAYHNQPLTKIKSSYDKLQKEVNKPPSDYESIKELAETKNISITNIKTNIVEKQLKILFPQKLISKTKIK